MTIAHVISMLFLQQQKKYIKHVLNTEQSDRYTNIEHNLIATKCYKPPKMSVKQELLR